MKSLLKIYLSLSFSLFLGTLFGQNLERLYNYDTQKWGVRDAEWNIVIPTIYDEIEPKLDTVFAAKKDGMTTLFNGDGTVRIPPIYQQILAHFNSFNNQFGYAGVTKNDKIPNSWGIVNSFGKIIIPEKYQYVRVINPDLFVAKTSTDTSLHFFNKKGNLRYKITGKYVDPIDIDHTCFGVRVRGGETIFYNSDGQMVWPKEPKSGFWTDGNLTALWKNRGTRESRLGMVNQAGETVIPFDFHEVKHGLNGQFILMKNDSSYKFEGSIVFDNKGKIIIPYSRSRFFVWGDLYAVVDSQTDKMGFFDATGKQILPSIFRYEMVRSADSEYNEKIPNSSPLRYYELTDMTTNQRFLVRNDGTVIRPENARHTRYFSEKHPFVVEMNAEEGKIGSKMAIDATGKALTYEPYFSLVYTLNPRVFIARKDQIGKQGFLNLDKPQATEWKYDRLERWQNGHYCGRNNSNFDLYDANFKMIYSGIFTIFNAPQKEEFETFRKEKKLKGRLVAVGRQPGMKYEEFIGINAQGETFLFQKKQTPQEVKPAPIAISVPKEDLAMEEAPPPPPVAEAEAEEIYNTPEKSPEYPGGQSALGNFLIANLKYPPVAAESAIQGQVIIQFVVEKDGSLTSIAITRDIGGGCGQEAIRIVSIMPKWTPGKQNGRPIRSKYSLPVQFRLQ